MAFSPTSRWKNTYRALSPFVLCSFIHAQTTPIPTMPPQTAPATVEPMPAPPTTPAPSPDSGSSLQALHLRKLPDATTMLPSATTSTSQPLHVLVGRSIFVITLTRLRRVYVSNPTVIDSFTSSARQIVVTAKTPGVSSLILWDENGQSTTYLVFSDVDVADLQTEIHHALPNDNITVEGQEDRVSLSGTVLSDASATAAVKLAGLYTKNVVNSTLVRENHLRQVKLKVQIVEIDRSKLEQFGINFFTQGKTQSNSTTGAFPSTQTYTPSSGTTAGSITTSNPLNLFFYTFGHNFGFTLQDLQNRQIAQILAEPTITTVSGQKASFLAGGEFPFPVVQGSSGGLTSITIQFRPYGVKLDFTPTVNDDSSIQLKVAPEVSALDYTNAVTISGYTIPAISTRRADTQVELRDGQSFAISGLLDHRTTDIFGKMPGIGDVPILGQLFRSKNINHSTVELMVIVTPFLVDPLNDASMPTPPQLPIPMLAPADVEKKTVKGAASAKSQPAIGGAK
jgi:pilus assembly protein CpaC